MNEIILKLTVTIYISLPPAPEMAVMPPEERKRPNHEADSAA